MKSRLFTLGLVLWMFNFPLSAADVQLLNLSLSAHNPQAQTIQVNFSLQWDYAWYNDINHDAVWVFLKFRTGSPLREIGGVNSNGLTFTVGSTIGLRAGMPLSLVSGSGELSPGTIITSINSATQFTVSVAPTTPLLDATLHIRHSWEHLYPSTTGHDPGTGTPVTIIPALYQPAAVHHPVNNPATGVFIKLSEPGEGICQVQQLSLLWPYGDQGVNLADYLEVRAFAVEMVYVPQGSFSLGDGAISDVAGHFHDASDPQRPFRVVGEASLTLGGSSEGQLTSGMGMSPGFSDDFDDGQEQILPASFPKGYQAFYAMKYPVSQQQYADFLNTLTRNQQEERTASVAAPYVMVNATMPVHRNGIRRADGPVSDMPLHFFCDLNGNGQPDGQDDGGTIACNYTSWSDLWHYAAWSGLRPMTELEYEKAARGHLTPNPNELVWGSQDVEPASGLLLAGTNQEQLFPVTANAAFQSILVGPHRVGIAARPDGNRQASAASFWGIADLSTNVFERTVSVGTASGRLFTGAHGKGSYHSTQLWPVEATLGSGRRGGAWSSQPLAVSSRGEVNVPDVSRDMSTGIRLVRTIHCQAPASVPDDIIGERYQQVFTPGWFSTGGGSSYLWTVPAGWTLLRSRSDGSAVILSGALNQGGELRVALNNTCGAGPETSFTVYAVE
jgi:formylglycine-generating enzyme required for sulfatase activity